MTVLEAFAEVLERLAAQAGAAVTLSEDELGEWPRDAVRAMRAQRLLTKAAPTKSAICPGCEQQCAMEVHTPPVEDGTASPFIVCDKREDINRVPVPVAKLRQWRYSAEAVGAFVAQSLGVRGGNQRRADGGLWELGLVTGKKRSQMVCLRAGEQLELVAGQNAVSLAELVSFSADGYSVDCDAVRGLVDAATGDSFYTPSIRRREERRQRTQALYQDWQKEYRALKKHRPGMSDLWYSQQIAKMDRAQGRNAETIRKHMKR